MAAYTRSMTPAQWGDEDQIDEDVATEVRRVASGAADTDVVKVKKTNSPGTMAEVTRAFD